MIYDNAFFDEPIDRRGTECEQWDCLIKREGRELLPMWVADMDLRCPVEITEALIKRAQHPVYGYTEQSENAVLAALDFLYRRHGLKLKLENQALMPCVVTGLRAAVNALTVAGDSVIIQPPVYGPFYRSVEDNGRKLALSPLTADKNGRYYMDFDKLEELCISGAKLMLLCNPHNPVSRAWTRDELSRLIKLLARYGVTLISDEIHADFVYEKGGFHSVLELAVDDDAQIVALTSASKTFNIAGLQQALLLTRNKALKGKLTAAMDNAGVVSGNIFALAATEAAYRYGDKWLDALLVYLKQAEELLRRELKARLPEAVVSPFEATYLAWINLRAYGLTTDELIARSRDKGVEFTPGTFFGKEAGEGFLRVNLACPHSQTLMAVQMLEKAVKGIE